MTNKNEQRKEPELRFPEFSGEWEEKELSQMSSSGQYGLNSAATNFDGENVYVRITDIDESSRKLLGKLTSPSSFSDDYKLNDNDLLFARTGASTGKSYLHKNGVNNYNYYFAGFLIRFIIDKEFDSNFIYQNTLTSKYDKWTRVMSMRSGQPGINSKEYGSLIFNVPSLKEQQKIGKFFSKLDRQIELEEKKLALLEEQKKGYMQKIFSQELRFKDENGEEYPEWEKTKFNKFLSVPLNQEKNSAVNKDKLLSVKLNLNGITKINQDKVLNIGSTVYYQRKSGQFIYGKQNFFNGSFYIIQEEFDGYYSSGDVPSLNINNSIIDNSFFLNYIGREVYYKNQEKYSSGTGSKRIHEQTLLGFEMNLPCMSEQKKIASFLENLNKQLETMNRKIINLKKLKNNYLHLIMV